MCFSLGVSAQECKLLFDLEGVKLHNPTEKRVNRFGVFEEAKKQFAQNYCSESNGEPEVTLTMSQIDSLMNLQTQPEYITVQSAICQLSDMQKLIDDQKIRLAKLSEELMTRQAQVDALKSNLGKKLQSDEQKNFIFDILEELASRGIYPTSKALSDLKKGKISKDLADLFNMYSSLLKLKSGFATQNIAGLNGEILGLDSLDVLYSLIKYPTYDSLPDGVKERNETRVGNKRFYVHISKSDIEFPTKTVVDSIPNPLLTKNLVMFPENLRMINILKIANTQENFNWLDSNDYNVKSEHYPMQITYRRYESHPEYLVTNSSGSKGVFDSDGKLVAYVLELEDLKSFNPVVNNLTAIYAHEYNANAYNIQSKDTHVRDYILEKAEVKFHPGSRAQRIANTKIRHIDQASLAEPDNDYMVKAILAQKEAERITRQDEIDHIKNYDRNGENWCNQIRSDWENKLAEDGLSWTEIITPTSYSVTYLDRNGSPILKEIYNVRNTTPYRIEIVKTVHIL